MAEENNLIPTVDIPDFTEADEEYDTQYRPSVMWDLEKGDFVRAATNVVQEAEGYEAYKVWCVKAVATERYARHAYSDDYGAEMEDALQEPDREAVQLAVERTIRECLLVNPRTEDVAEFQFSWDDPGHLHVSFTVYSVDDEVFTVDTTVDTE